MGLTSAFPRNHAAVHAQFQRQTVEQQSVPLAHRLFVNQGPVRRILQFIIRIIQIVIIIRRIPTDKAVNRLKFLIIRAGVHIQLIQHLTHPLIYGLLLFIVRVIGVGIGECYIVHSSFRRTDCLSFCVPSAVLPS